MEDPALVAYLARTQLPLTVCPLSNVKLGIFPALKHHNVRQMLAAGLRATINSDDPAYFGGYVGDNFLAVKDALQLTDVQLVGLARNSFLPSFITAGERQRYLARLEAAYAQHQTEPVCSHRPGAMLRLTIAEHASSAAMGVPGRARQCRAGASSACWRRWPSKVGYPACGPLTL